MKCVVYGGGGFIGSSVVDRLLAAGHFVRVFASPRTLPYREFHNERLEWVQGDFSSRDDVAMALADMDAVIHLISYTLPQSANDNPVSDVSNVISSVQLLDAMVAKHVGRLVFISSGGTVYGAARHLPIDEGHPTQPKGFYGLTKLTIERYITLYAETRGIDAIVLRVANAYGIRQKLGGQGAVGAFLSRAIHGIPIQIWGDGETRRDYIYVTDVAEAFARALEYSGEHRVFNVGTGIGTSLSELITVIQDVVGHPVRFEKLPGRAFDISDNVLDISHIQREMMWQPQTTLREGVSHLAKWLFQMTPRS